jgi:2,3-bisphosphoglycerate-independent phosphoglycerate mutase
MRYAIIIVDGAADKPNDELSGKTPLQAANAPAINAMAKEGHIYLAKTVPEGYKPGSDVACLSVLGYNPAECYTGRAPLEAASIGIELKDGQAVYRANTVTIENDIMKDYAAGHLSNEEAEKIITYLDANLNIDGVKLHVGTQYRHACVIDGAAGNIGDQTPPHDILDQEIASYMPRGGVAEKIIEIMAKTKELLAGFEVNKERIAKGKSPVTQLWLWGGGTMPELQTYKARFNISGGLISAVDLLKGIGHLAGLDIINVEGATGFYDTNYEGKGKAALECIDKNDFVAVHVEAPDEAGHNGEVHEKVKAIENIDKFIATPLLEKARKEGDIRILVMPDHPTPIEIRTHTSDPVPACMWGPGIESNGAEMFDEDNACEKGEDILASLLLEKMIKA